MATAPNAPGDRRQENPLVTKILQVGQEAFDPSISEVTRRSHQHEFGQLMTE